MQNCHDHRADRALLAGLLQPEFEVVGEAHDTLALGARRRALSPDVIVSDISMPGLDGIAAATQIVRRNPAARIVFVTVHCDPLLVERGFQAGALGYVIKGAAGDELIPAVRSALRGERHVSRELHPNGMTRKP